MVISGKEERERGTPRSRRGALDLVKDCPEDSSEINDKRGENLSPNKLPPYSLPEVKREAGGLFLPVFMGCQRGEKTERQPLRLSPLELKQCFLSFLFFDLTIVRIAVLFAKRFRMLQPLFPLQNCKVLSSRS